MNITQIVEQLKQRQVVAYPTEAVFGLGCNPHSESAVQNLLILKNRPIEKGLILIAPTLDLLLPFIDENQLNEKNLAKLTALYVHPVTWIVPAKADVPIYLTGRFDSIAVRLCRHPAVVALCEQTGFALTSTSANLSGFEPCKTAIQVRSQFGENFPVLDMDVGNAERPSEIRDIFTDQIIRQG
ncbi:translation factor SUA5 [Cricetibacter osteomyelitidis]|uniref:Threonylcarbamoyl-AMP synthase n=1 Tax=Cricetibacter osteomyelitidis TaxID=1521931 RepID=A0A4R2T283_9PAST|nr:Sua5/YciO/YrdC/YwlC family protein [Cricetibacter osteomyelitidis]TCP94914.1 translation factor SUA5 [Cricetibacter osteomyelitidis]